MEGSPSSNTICR